MEAAGETLSFSRQQRRPAAPACARPGRHRGRFRKIHCSAKRAHWPANRPFPAKSRTTNLGPFGEVIRATGPMAKVNPFRFSTKYQDDETDIIMYPHRPYSPSTGRFLSRDPIGELGFRTSDLVARYNSLLSENIASAASTDRDPPDIPGTEDMDMPPELVDALHSPYRFVDNNPVSLIDPLGEDIYLQTGNNSGNPVNDRIHQQICVDTWSGKIGCCGTKTEKRCFSFGQTGHRLPIPSMTWLFWHEFNAGGPLVGEVYETDYTGGTVVGTIKTTCKQDIVWLTGELARVGATDTYSVARHNCRRYSQYEFRDAPSLMGPP
jgi:RHS repeat-associated protein